MTLARKNSRRIEVDTSSYRWTVSSNDLPNVAIVVQSATGRGQRLVSWVEYGVAISPALVRLAILDGLAAGWTPSRPGRDFIRDAPKSSGTMTAAVQCPCCDHFSLPTRGQYDICPICFWEDDGLDLDQPDIASGPNHITLREARANFLKFGACDLSARQHILDELKRTHFKRALRETPEA